MRASGLFALAAALLLAACASVRTQVVQLNPAQHYEPTQTVEVLLTKPTRPHVEIALLESRGVVGASEADLLNDARDKARALGADAIVRIETERVYQQPVPVYDPWYDPFSWSYHRYRPFPPFTYPWGHYRLIGGGYRYEMKAMAIRYTAVGKAEEKAGVPR